MDLPSSQCRASLLRTCRDNNVSKRSRASARIPTVDLRAEFSRALDPERLHEQRGELALDHGLGVLERPGTSGGVGSTPVGGRRPRVAYRRRVTAEGAETFRRASIVCEIDIDREAFVQALGDEREIVLQEAGGAEHAERCGRVERVTEDTRVFERVLERRCGAIEVSGRECGDTDVVRRVDDCQRVAEDAPQLQRFPP